MKCNVKLVAGSSTEGLWYQFSDTKDQVNLLEVVSLYSFVSIVKNFLWSHKTEHNVGLMNRISKNWMMDIF